MLPYVLLSFSSLFWSLNFIIGKMIAGVFPPITISFFRWGVPLLLYLCFVWKDLWRDRQVYLRNWKLILALGATGYCLNSITVYAAVLFTSTINTSFINAFNPVLIALAGFLLYRYPITGMQVAGFSLSLAGVIWIIFKGDPALILRLHMNIGDLFMVGSLFAWALHTVLYKQYAWQFPAQSLFIAMILGGIIVTIPLMIIENAVVGLGWVEKVGSQHILGILCLSIFPSVLAYRFWNYALDKVDANKVAIFQYLIPVYTVIISLVFLDEQLQGFQLAGGLLIFLGVMLVANKRNEAKQTGE